jgi:hypothetical protein
MTTSEIAGRLEARPRGTHWLARCPSHDDRRPSLSIREGVGGKTLLHCFAGCAAEAIVASVGLGVPDLFADSPSGNRRPLRSTIESAQAALDGELLAILDREEQRLGFRPPALAQLKNQARAAVERRFNVRLSRHLALWWEIEPHALDPAWASCVDRAIDETAWGNDIDPEELRKILPEAPAFKNDVLQRARQLQHELAGAT